MTKKELAQVVFARIKKLAIPVKMDGPWVVLDGKAPSDLVVDMAMCDANELAKLVREDQKQ